jgi:hypothetical protein
MNTVFADEGAGAFLNSEERHLAGAAEDREHRDLIEEIDGIVAPFAGRDHATIESENAVQLGPLEANLRGREAMSA